MSDKGIIVIYYKNRTEQGRSQAYQRKPLVDPRANRISLQFEQIQHFGAYSGRKGLDKNSVVRIFRTTASDGKQYNVKHYNLDMVFAIGYRVRSNVGTNFRKWATSTLKEYVTKGFALNDDLLKEAGGRQKGLHGFNHYV